jgi:hypothetical protein
MQHCWRIIYYNVGGELDISHHILVILEFSMCAVFSYRENGDFSILMKDICCVCGRVALQLPTVCWIFIQMLQGSSFISNFWCCIGSLWENLFLTHCKICYSCGTDWRCDDWEVPIIFLLVASNVCLYEGTQAILAFNEQCMCHTHPLMNFVVLFLIVIAASHCCHSWSRWWYDPLWRTMLWLHSFSFGWNWYKCCLQRVVAEILCILIWIVMAYIF